MLDEIGGRATVHVDAIPKDQLLATPVDDLVEHVASGLFIEPLIVYQDRMTRRQSETQIDVKGWPGRCTRGNGPCLVPGVSVNIFLPFSGDPKLWRMFPHRYLNWFPRGIVLEGSNVVMSFECPADEDLNQIKSALEQNLRSISSIIAQQNERINGFNSSLRGTIRPAIEARRQRLAQHDKLADILKIPLKHNPNAPEMRPIQVQRRAIKPLPPPPIGGYKSEWEIVEQEYELVLNVIRHEGRTFEKTPKTYAVHDEEELRDILLAHLNGHYPGEATAETFRRSGKTDITIEKENRAAFVAECKVWQGPKTVPESVDQLLGYLTWRDCKAAVIIFNKNIAGFTEILAKVKPALESHPRFVKIVAESEKGEWRCVFRSKDDDARLVHLQVFLFNLYTS